MEKYSKLISLALMARENAYAPYSGFRVGACLVTDEGQAYLGCNVENSSFSHTICAERNAIFKAVSEGHKKFSAIAIVGGKGERLELTYPCGACRQVLSEFVDDDFKVILYDGENIEVKDFSAVFPSSFKLKMD
ncbi:MAG: cytidine deaminase [Clostridia bacterium]|nr:cytidine deaminase [Clostridia bacterium]